MLIKKFQRQNFLVFTAAKETKKKHGKMRTKNFLYVHNTDKYNRRNTNLIDKIKIKQTKKKKFRRQQKCNAMIKKIDVYR